MSLFPAYSEQANITPNNDKVDEKWLENSSFQVDLDVLKKIGSTNVPKSTDSCKTVKSKKKKRKKQHRERSVGRKEELRVSDPTSDDFYIQTSGNRELLTVDRIVRPAAPYYTVKYKLFDWYGFRKRKKFKRYFSILLDKVNQGDLENETITKQDLNKPLAASSKNNDYTGFKQEEELSQKTAYFNRYLSENPSAIEVWQNYIDFQDTMYQFEKTYRKGSIAKAQRVLAERKLCIIDKALSLNPNSDQLHRERLKICVEAFPADELQAQLKILIDKNKENLIIWQGYIEATQCSMSHCNTPAVMKLYSECLSTLHQLRRATTSVEKQLFEESILRMLYKCGLFLKQAGLFEQLWVLLRMYLELNLSPNDPLVFDITSNFNEKQLFELEEVIFTSQLPLHELWLRTEKLRESCHWLPYAAGNDNDECEDPQRIVFADDVAELIHPITIDDNIFRMVATIISLLKVPLLPCRHTTMQELGLDYVPWSLDSIESLLSVFLPLYPIEVIDTNLFDSGRLAVGPQYLKLIPGRDEYLDFVLKVIENCGNCLKDDYKVSLMVWFMRFQRLLIKLEKLEQMKLPENLKKRMKKNIKDFLKKPDNRQNEIYYLEYALIEFEQGNMESSFNILNVALNLNRTEEVLTRNWSRAQAARSALFTHLVHMNIVTGNESMAKICLCELPLQKKIQETSPIIVKSVEEKYNRVTVAMLADDLNKIELVHHFHPDFFTNWIICHGWFIYLHKTPQDCLTFIENVISNLEDRSKDPQWQKEVLYEFHIAILFKICIDFPASGNFTCLDKTLYKVVNSYPNNLFLLSVVAKEQNLFHTMGPQWWKVQGLLLNTGRSFSTVFAVVILNQQMKYLQEVATDTITGEHNINPNLKNMVLSLFKKITKTTVSTRRCGLIWRLYLQFVYTYFSLDTCRNVYYSAVEECPWLKALYIDAAIYIPAELSQIQDLIIEKQLRLHVTPEELDALRS